MLKDILLAFIPIFVAVDPVGLLPLFVSLTHDIKKKQRDRIVVQSLITAFSLGIVFIIVGKGIFRFLGITVGDFMIAGGSILFCIAILDLIKVKKEQRIPPEDLGAVPIGTPLIVGPAVLTTSLILVDQYGMQLVIISFVLNILLVGIMFYFSDGLMKFLGRGGSRALSKVIAVLLAAIGIMMIRKGIISFLL